jgi:hypothetical protein
MQMLNLRSAQSGALFLGEVDGDTLIWSAAAKKWTVGRGGSPWNVFGLQEGDEHAEENTRILEAYAQSGYVAVLPPGEYYLAEGSLLADVCLQLQTGLDNFTLRGQGEGITTLKLGNGVECMVININGASNIKIQNLTVDGNRENNTGTSWHGIRTGALGVDGLELSGITVQNTRGYGFGMQGGDKKRFRMENCSTVSTGLDGCDFKNESDNSEDMVIVAFSARDWGLDTDGIEEQAGLDLRGPVQVFGVWTSGGPVDGHHVRVREGETVDPSLGGHYSHLHGIVCEGAGGSQIGLYIAARDVGVFGAQVSNCLINALVNGERVSLVAVTCDGALDENFQVNVAALDCRLAQCHSRNAVHNAFRLRGPRSVLTGCSSNNDAFGGVTLEATATDCTIAGLTGVGLGGTTVGIDNAATGLTVQGGELQAFFRGFSTVAARSKVLGLVARNSTGQGFLVGAGGDDCSLIGCTAHANATINIQMRAARGRVIGCSVTSSGNTGLDITASATGTLIDDNTFSANAGVALGDAGTGTTVGLNAGLLSPYLTESVKRLAGTGSPEGVHTAPVGSFFQRTDGGAGTSFYVKEVGAGNTGWVAK